MATPTTNYFALTGDNLIDGITHGYYWRLDSTRTVDYSISNGFLGEYWYAPTTVATYLGAALDTYANYANIKFSYSGYFTTPSIANYYGSEINLSLDSGRFISSSSIWAKGYFPDSSYNTSLYSGAPGDIYLNINSQANYLSSYDPGSAGWFLLMHELGHTLGLKHPHDNGGTGRPTFTQLGISNFDIDWATVMSYNDDNGSLTKYDPATPMILDVLGLQYIYGKNLNTNTGNTSYTLAETNFYYTLWDAAGTDTLDASTASAGWTIYLPREAWSTLVDTKVGVALPTSGYVAGTPTTLVWLAGDYENVKGSNYADVIEGNSFSNSLNGNLGNDIMYGFEGDDTFDWDSSRLGNDTMYGGVGNDTYVVDSTNDLIIEYENEGTDSIWSPVNYSLSLLVNIEKLYLFGTNNIAGTGNALNNTLAGTSGNNLLDGASGIDTAVYSGTAASHTITNGSSTATVVDKTANRDGTDTLTNIERLSFTDTNIALDVEGGQNAGMAYRMYKAALNRAPDLQGLGDWIYVLDHGADIYNDLAHGFVDSLEFKARYGANLSNTAFVTLLYNNVLGRDPDQGGLDAWVGVMNHGASREVVLHGFSESPENINYSLGLIGQGMPYTEHLG